MPVLARGFRLAGVHCGIKQNSNVEDLALVVSDDNCTAAGVYTQNLVVAPPVVVDRNRTPYETHRVVVVNSGNANACTGSTGLSDAEEMIRLATLSVGAQPNQGLVMSTGIIGEYLPMERIAGGIAGAARILGRDENSLSSATRAMMTTDLFPKLSYRQLDIGGGEITITGIAKGAGMIGPNMATMLGLVMTDARLSPGTAQTMLRTAVDVSFNCIAVEGHTSTNDTVLLLASGAGHALKEKDHQSFQVALTEVCTELAKMIPDDGEGASHLIEILVDGCRRECDARQIAKTVALSNLVKTAVAGADPNWGRIVSAVGYAGIPLDPDEIDLSINGIGVYRQGTPLQVDAQAVSQSIRNQRETTIHLKVGNGEASSRFWTSDLTPDYVRFNSDYHT